MHAYICNFYFPLLFFSTPTYSAEQKIKKKKQIAKCPKKNETLITKSNWTLHGSENITLFSPKCMVPHFTN